jgi:CelD/BcsL family acetyltransferase involved in cellulose biosynthesis
MAGRNSSRLTPSELTMPRVIEINDFDQLEGYRLLWHKLLAETRNASHFQSLDWLEAWWRHHGAGQTLRVLVVRSGDETLGILPLTVRTEPTKVGPLRVLTYPLDGGGSFYGPIGPQSAATLAAALKHIQQSRRDWDLLDLRGVHRDGCDFGRTPNALRFNQFQAYEQPWKQVPTVDLASGWDDYWASRDNVWKTNLRRSEQNLAQRGTVTYVRYRPAGAAYDDGEPRWDLYGLCESLAMQSSQGLQISDATTPPAATREFFREAHAYAAHAGGVDVNLLFLDGRPVAYAYNYHYQGRVESLAIGSDVNLSTSEPGSALMTRMLQDSCQRGDHTFLLAAGPAATNGRWHTSLETSYRYTHFPVLGIRAQALRLNRWMHSRRQTTLVKTSS